MRDLVSMPCSDAASKLNLTAGLRTDGRSQRHNEEKDVTVFASIHQGWFDKEPTSEPLRSKTA